MRWIPLLALLLAGCAADFRKGQVLIGCVNVTGPGFSWQCPETLQTPQLPDSQKPPPPSP